MAAGIVCMEGRQAKCMARDVHVYIYIHMLTFFFSLALGCDVTYKGFEHRQPCERPQWLPLTSNELAKKCHDPTRSSVHIIIINLDYETDPRDVHSRALTALVTAMALL